MMLLEPEIYQDVVRHTPLISIDLIVSNGHEKYLLGLRKNNPAKGFFFVPGSRILKDEKIIDAFERITIDELGKKIMMRDSRFLGFYEHFYSDNFANVSGFGTHYVVLAFELVFYPELCSLSKTQHSKYIWMTKDEVMQDDKIHIFTKDYFHKDLLNNGEMGDK